MANTAELSKVGVQAAFRNSLLRFLSQCLSNITTTSSTAQCAFAQSCFTPQLYAMFDTHLSSSPAAAITCINGRPCYMCVSLGALSCSAHELSSVKSRVVSLFAEECRASATAHSGPWQGSRCCIKICWLLAAVEDNVAARDECSSRWCAARAVAVFNSLVA
jgi:hypothetical protein